MEFETSETIKILAAMLGGGGLFSFLTVRAAKMKIEAEAQKANAESHSITISGTLKVADAAAHVVEMLREELERIQKRLDKVEKREIELKAELQALRIRNAELERKVKDYARRLNIQESKT